MAALHAGAGRHRERLAIIAEGIMVEASAAQLEVDPGVDIAERHYRTAGAPSRACAAKLETGVNLTSEARKRGARAPKIQSRTAPGEAGREAGQKSDKTSAGRY